MTNETTPARRPRRVRALGLLAGLLAVAAVAPAAASASKVTVQEHVYLDFRSAAEGGPYLLSSLSSPKEFCRHDRMVEVDRSDGTVFADQRYSVDGNDLFFISDGDYGYTYTVKIAKKKLTKPNGQKVVCSGGEADLYVG